MPLIIRFCVNDMRRGRQHLLISKCSRAACDEAGNQDDDETHETLRPSGHLALERSLVQNTQSAGLRLRQFRR